MHSMERNAAALEDLRRDAGPRTWAMTMLQGHCHALYLHTISHASLLEQPFLETLASYHIEMTGDISFNIYPRS